MEIDTGEGSSEGTFLSPAIVAAPDAMEPPQETVVTEANASRQVD